MALIKNGKNIFFIMNDSYLCRWRHNQEHACHT